MTDFMKLTLHKYMAFSTQRQPFTQQLFNSNANPVVLQGKQLQIYQAMIQHFAGNFEFPLHIVISDTARTGKLFIINCFKMLLGDKLHVCTSTGI